MFNDEEDRERGREAIAIEAPGLYVSPVTFQPQAAEVQAVTRRSSRADEVSVTHAICAHHDGDHMESVVKTITVGIDNAA